MRAFAEEVGGRRQPVQFKGKIQGTQSWELRQAGRQQEKGKARRSSNSSRQAAGIC